MKSSYYDICAMDSLLLYQEMHGDQKFEKLNSYLLENPDAQRIPREFSDIFLLANNSITILKKYLGIIPFWENRSTKKRRRGSSLTQKIESEIIDILTKRFPVPNSQIVTREELIDHTFQSLDDIDLIEFHMDLEDHYKIEIYWESGRELAGIRETAKYIIKTLRKKDEKPNINLTNQTEIRKVI
ncbi:MAG: hypothetical protein Q8P57_05305 [Candidatus Pacearchaeota archaeon]|nr:hypothetical protein [Candidatus Pacearchaeota archaeon]